jgi:hypothetical protein
MDRLTTKSKMLMSQSNNFTTIAGKLESNVKDRKALLKQRWMLTLKENPLK